MSRIFQKWNLRKFNQTSFCLIVGICGSGSLYYLNSSGSLFGQFQRSSILPPPKRTTDVYVTGCGNKTVFSKQVNGLWRRVYCLLFMWYRMGLLFLRGLPVAWYGFLAYKLHLCPEDFFNKEVVKFLTMMGPSYMKLGQWMATRPDVFPPELCKALETLFDNTTPHGWKHTEKVLRNSCCLCQRTENPNHPFSCVSFGGGKDISREGKSLDILMDIDKIPINSGTIAQIHRAKLRFDLDGLPAGTSLALKVRHPNIAETMAADLGAMKVLAKMVTKIVPGAHLFNLRTSLQEFEALVSSQLDMRIECDNLLQFRYNFRHFSGVIFPTPLPSLGTEELLVETFEEGEHITNLECSDGNSDVAETGCHMFMKMLFEDNFVHSDLHPGNILLRTNPRKKWSIFYDKYLDGKRKRPRELIILDVGLVTTLSQRERNNFISLFAAVACGEGELGADLMIERFPTIVNDNNTKHPKSNINIEKFREDMKKIFEVVAPDKQGFKLSQIKIGEVLRSIMSAIRENKAPLDGNFASLVLTVVVGEGLGRKLTPDFNLFAEASPYLITYLEGGELYFLSKKLQETYGAPGLIKESSQMFKIQQVFTFAKAAHLKIQNMIKTLVGMESV